MYICASDAKSGSLRKTREFQVIIHINMFIQHIGVDNCVFRGRLRCDHRRSPAVFVQKTICADSKCTVVIPERYE